MKTFKEFLNESAMLEKIEIIVDSLDNDEIDQFGYFLYDNFFDLGEEDDAEAEDLYFDKETVLTLIEELGEDFYPDILNFLDEIDDTKLNMDSEGAYYDPDDPAGDGVNESVSRRMLSKNRSRKKRNFMEHSVADLRRTAQKRKRDNRMHRAERRRYYKANKQKIAMYQKSRNAAIAAGKHIPKLRRKSG